MRIEIDIPKEFEEHFKQDKFKDSFERIMADIKHSLENGDCLCAGRYEYETIEMLEKALENSKSAYNVDKVIEELYEERTEILLSNDYECEIINYCLDNFDNAIEIVKQMEKMKRKKINIMGHNSIEEQKQSAKNTNELLNYLIEIIEQNNKRFSFEWAVGGEHATMEIFDNEKEIGYVVNIEPIKYDETGKAINV